jgi:hypothetical protein
MRVWRSQKGLKNTLGFVRVIHFFMEVLSLLGLVVLGNFFGRLTKDLLIEVKKGSYKFYP